MSRSGRGCGVVVVFGGVAIVGPAFEAPVELGRDPTVRGGGDVVDVAVRRRHVAAGGVLAVPVAHVGWRGGSVRRTYARDDMPSTVRSSPNTTALEVGGTQVRHHVVRSEHGAGGQLAQLIEALFADEHADQWAWPLRNGRGRGGAGCHLDQGGGASLRRGAHDAGGFVGEILLAFEPVELGQEDGATDGIEPSVETHRVIQRRRRMQMGPIRRIGGVGLAAGSVDTQLPVGERRHGLAVTQGGAVVDEHRFVTGEVVMPGGAVRPGQQLDVIHRQPALGHGSRGDRHHGEGAGPRQVAAGGGQRT